ncbi:MAG TPA: hypothetical protein VLF40_01975 [Candidatus Saccharimonadales bacterium]|nr:hypothetical protein [Candidatus Saccharimonadales bacterium]
MPENRMPQQLEDPVTYDEVLQRHPDMDPVLAGHIHRLKAATQGAVEVVEVPEALAGAAAGDGQPGPEARPLGFTDFMERIAANDR